MTKKAISILPNADDFGRHVLINSAVAKAVDNGCLRSATLMPGGRAFDDAVDVAKSHPELGVGIHLTLVNGFPVSDPKDIPSLVTEEGVFLDDYTLFVKAFLKGKIRLADVRRELMAQAEKMGKTGLDLTHVDSHQHMHVLPGIFDIALDAADSLHIDAVRIPRSPLFTGFSGSLGQLIGRTGLATLAEMAGLRAKHRHFRTPDHFAGIVAGEAVHEGHFRDILKHLAKGTTEIMMHPGIDNRILVKDTRWDHDFEAEYHALVSPAIAALIEKKGIRVVNFSEIG